MIVITILHPWRSRNIPSRFIQQKLEIRDSLMDLLAHMQKLPLSYHNLLCNCSQDLKLRILEICLIVMVTIIIIPYSGWSRAAANSTAPLPAIKWTTVFRNASGVLRNVSSAGPEARRVMRDCDGLVDSFVWIIKAPLGKNDIDNKVCCER